ncbi:unnamed protein product [Paramecium sonneborni]|uniref:Uncharacterized protein n=1 Tax=Paramecium sonneborni TaxID=65129 RepID=A0A8S1R676_9CILI|nr:unnamed protein product [Paramecium sonneborni]
MQQSQNLTPSIGKYITKWWKNLGFGQRLLLFLQVLLLLINQYVYPIENRLSHKTLNVINGDFWRLFTAPLCSNSFNGILLNWFFFQMVVNTFETIVGSAFFIFDFVLKSFLLESLNFLLNFGLSYYDPSYIHTESSGISGLTIYYLCSSFIASPYSKTNFGIISIKNYFIILTILFGIIYQTQDLIYVIGFQFAIFEWYFFDGMIIRLSNNSIEKLSYIFGSFKHNECFKQPKQSLQEPKVAVQQQVDDSQQKTDAEDFGGRGIMIGTDEEKARQSRPQGQNNYQQI